MTREAAARGRGFMLVLSRKANEEIVIDNTITVTVIEIRGDRVRLGITAPKEIPVHRREVYEAIRRSEGRCAGHQEGAPDADRAD